MRLPRDLLDAKAWLIWRYEQVEGEPKPRKVPYYTSGRKRSGSQGSDEDLAALSSYDVAARVAAKKGYNGVGLAMRKDLGLVALDFDNCVVDGKIEPHVIAMTEGTYSEFSPSGLGVRAFFLGELQNRKDHSVGFEVFCSTGYVTLTGQETPDSAMWEWGVAPVSDALLDYYHARFGRAATAGEGDDDWLMGLSPKVGLTIERAKVMLEALDSDIGYEDWLAAGQALHHEFDGSEAALEVWREWSKRGEKYPGDRTIDGKWQSFGRYRGSPITAAWLLKHSKVAKVVARYEAEGEWKAKVREAEDDYDLREKVCPEIARDARLGDIERETLVQVVMARLRTLGSPLPIKSVRKMLAPPSSMVPTVKQKRPLTEFGNAERMLDKFGRSLMFVPELAAWYVWTGIYWRRASEVEIEHYAKETVRHLSSEVEDHDGDIGEFWGFCAISQQARMVRNMVSLAASDPRVMVPVEELDKMQYMLGVQNGVVDLRSGKLLPPDSDMRVTRVCACDYRPGAKSELWQRTVLDVFNDDIEMSAFFQRLVGYMALGNPTEDIMVIAHGNGSNGKSTVFGTLRKVLGGYARSANADTFIADGRGGNAGGAREDLVRLRGARMVYVNEPDEQGELREGTVKGMTGGDAITARGLWAKESIEFMPSWVVVMPTNHKPIVKGSDNGIWRRLMLVPFTRNFENDPRIVKDDKREEKLDAEAEGVLSYIVEGARAYLRDGLSAPGIVRNAREQYRSQMDLLSEWVEDRCEVNPAFREQSQRLWQSWEEYARERGILRYVPSSIALGRRLDQRFPSEKGSRGVRMRIGLRLKEGEMYRDDFFGDIF